MYLLTSKYQGFQALNRGCEFNHGHIFEAQQKQQEAKLKLRKIRRRREASKVAEKNKLYGSSLRRQVFKLLLRSRANKRALEKLPANLDKAKECIRLISFETCGICGWTRNRSTRIPKPAGSFCFQAYNFLEKDIMLKTLKKRKSFSFLVLWSFSEHKHCQYGADYDYDDDDGYDSVYEGGI